MLHSQRLPAYDYAGVLEQAIMGFPGVGQHGWLRGQVSAAME